VIELGNALRKLVTGFHGDAPATAADSVYASK
jgi:hypothetical protein